MSLALPSCSIDALQARLGLAAPLLLPTASRSKPLTQWQMEIDDAPIFRYLYRSFRPRRHLEFGTWQGTGTTYCLEECEATVWTINLPGGEMGGDGGWAYHRDFAADEALPAWANRRTTRSGRVVCQTDALGFIGREYLAKGLGHRVCQIYCDSTQWDTANYPAGFFDSALIDGGHSEPVVVSDTRKALALLRSGGLILWHDYCPDAQVERQCESVRGVLAAIASQREWLATQLADLFWVEPSWILLGVKR